jgi:phosphoserine phosphatase RsbU/P
LPLGIAECAYEECTVDMRDAGTVLFYTDGITEAENRALEEFGPERLREHAAAPDVSVDSVLQAVCRFTDCRPLADDATLIVLRSRP